MIGGQGDREFAHFHGRYIDPDSSEGKAHRGIPWQSWQGGGLGSMHLTLSLTDAVRVIEAGWGEPHLLAGKMAAAGLLLVYAPRDEQEVDVVISILRASVDNARGAKIG